MGESAALSGVSSLASRMPASPSWQGLYLLVSTILGSGRSTQPAQAAARRLLGHFGSPRGMSLASPEEIRRAGKVSPRQAAALTAALELGRWICSSPLQPGEAFRNSRDLYDRYRARFVYVVKEHFYSLHLNTKNQLIREVLVSIGSLSASVVHPREVFAQAVRDSTASLILMHNHPSGDPSPSREDRECTQRLVRAGRILGIRVLDHVIIGEGSYFSFADSAEICETG